MIKKMLCDLHPHSIMARAEHRSFLGEDWVRTVMHKCLFPGCLRNFTRTLGYHDAAKRRKRTETRQCSANHPAEFMVLTEIDNGVIWACPFENCRTQLPYGFGLKIR